MRLVVVGGHSRNIGKTSVAAAIVAATSELGWTAFKLTQHTHEIGAADLDPGAGRTEEALRSHSITRELNRDERTDTSRLLAAGARECYWVQAREGRLGEAIPEIVRIAESKRYVIMESNSVLRFLLPDLYLVVLDGTTADFKRSAREYLDRASAFVWVQPRRGLPAWSDPPLSLIEGRPVCSVTPPDYLPREILPLVRAIPGDDPGRK